MGSPKQGTPRISEEPSGNIRTRVGIFLSYSDYILEVPCLCPVKVPLVAWVCNAMCLLRAGFRVGFQVGLDD